MATVQDTIYEPSQTVLLNLFSTTDGASIAQGIGTINNDDPGPAFSVNDVSVAEGGNLVFTVTKSGATEVTHAVNYATANGTATDGALFPTFPAVADYIAASGSLTFAAGETTETIAVATIRNRWFDQATEIMYLNLSSAANGATISDSQGIGTIIDVP